MILLNPCIRYKTNTHYYTLIPSGIKSLVQGNNISRYIHRSSSRFELSKKSGPEPSTLRRSNKQVDRTSDARARTPWASWSAEKIRSAGGPLVTTRWPRSQRTLGRRLARNPFHHRAFTRMLDSRLRVPLPSETIFT